MYEKKIIHRDIKTENFLIKYINKEKTKYIIKLGDYGIGKIISTSVSNIISSGIKGSIETIAPEILLEKTTIYESTVDIYSLGVILYQLSHNLNHPYEIKLVKLIREYDKHFENDDLNIKFDNSIKNENFKDLVSKMLKLKPQNRLKWKEYIDHPFFK